MPEFLNSSFGARLSICEVAEAITSFIKEEPERQYKVMVGTDSERLSDGTVDFVSAVVVHRVGNGGRYFWRPRTEGKFHTLRDRIIREVIISLDVGKEILEAFRNIHVPAKWDFEIHADIGERGPTKGMIQEVVGMIRAHNFEARMKPDSYAASKVADRHV